MSSQSIPRTVVSLLVVLTLACATSPNENAGPYALQRVDQDPLPAVVFDGDVYALYMLADTIVFLGSDAGTISRVLESVPLQPGFPADGPVHVQINFRYTTSGEDLIFEFECPPDADCIPGPHLIARRVPRGLTARWGPGSENRSPLVYTQVDATP